MKKHSIPLSIITVCLLIAGVYAFFEMILPPPVMDGYETMCVIFLLVLVALVYGVYYLAFIKKAPFHKCYLPIGLVFGVIFMFMIPPYVTPDEPSHIWSAYYVSNQILGYGEPTDSEAKMVVRASEAGAPLEHVVTRASYNQILENILVVEDADGKRLVDSYTSYNSPLYLYYISAIGVTIGRLLSLGAISTLLLGTLCNMLFFVFSAYYAIKKVPFGKLIMAGYCLLPMVLQQTSSFSYDGIVIAASTVIVSLGLKWGFTEDKPTRSEIIAFLFYSIFMIGGKGGVYSMFCFLPLLYGLSKDKIKVLWKEYKWSIAFLMMLFVVILFSGTIKNVLSSSAVNKTGVSEEISTTESVEEDVYIISWAGEEGYTVSWVLQHPLETIKIWINTIRWNGTFYLYTLFGSSLGWWQIGVPFWIIWLYGVMALVNTISVKGERQMTIPDRAWVTMFSALSCIMCMAAMFFFWSPKSYGSIIGVQGRYFLPPYLAMMYCLRNNKIAWKRDMERPLLMINLALAILAVWGIMRNF